MRTLSPVAGKGWKNRARRADLSAVLDLASLLDRDGRSPGDDVRERDRRIGRDLETLGLSPRGQILAWLSRVPSTGASLPGEKFGKGVRLGSAFLTLLGVLSGWLAAAAVFYYDGSRPVNVVHVLAVFVALQLLLVALLLLTLLPRGVLGRIPGVSSLLEALELLSPGRLQRLAVRYLPQEHRERAAALLGASRAHRALFGRLEKWLVTSSAQLFAVAFNVGALLGCLYLIFFSDLAFSWSTTLRVEATDVHTVTSMLAAPWRALAPQAVPSLSLIEASHFYRLKGGVIAPGLGATAADPGALGGWWPFLVMSMAVYGLLPRVVLLIFARWRLQSSVDRTLLHMPGSTDLLERMNRQLVETQSREAEGVETLPEYPGEVTAPPMGKAVSCALVNWGEVPLGDEEARRSVSTAFGCSPAAAFRAGAPLTPATDRDVMERAARLAGSGGVIVLVRAWEPPLEEFLDFLAGLRSFLPEGAAIIVAPVGVDESSRPAPPTPFQLEVWRGRMRGLGDPWLSVRPLEDE